MPGQNTAARLVEQNVNKKMTTLEVSFIVAEA